VTDQPWQLDARALLEGYRRGTLSPVEALQSCAQRIEQTAPLNAFGAVDIDGAMADARQAERRYAGGDALPLDGVPVAVKDLIDTRGLRTTYGSAIHRERVPEADAEAVRRVRAAGGLIVGKTSTHEFAWGITCENPHYGPTRNPWDRARVSGGSSGGSAVAVATGAVPLALGTDTGGSIRIPAAFCGVVGHKPTYGSVPTAGVFPLAPSLDHVGSIARTPHDAALLWGLLADGAQPRAAAGSEPGGPPRIGVRTDGGLAPPQAEVVEAVERTTRALEEMGARLEEVELPDPTRVQTAFAGIQSAEALSIHRRAGLFPERSGEYGPDVAARLRAAGDVDVARYMVAQGSRGEIRRQLMRSLKGVDYLLTPVSAGPPKTIGEKAGNAFRELVLGFTMPQNVAGLPALVLRGGVDRRGLPIGIQLTAASGADTHLLELGGRLQEALGGARDWPAVGPPP
jgi:aspartyl-tRNA(Asn)/glutamyl-tRNA(Gln) amidotransferase subunit A